MRSMKMISEGAELPEPDISMELVEWLEALHPNKAIGERETLEAAHRRGGKQDLIAMLRAKAEVQDEMSRELDPDSVEVDDD